jgi:glutamate-1-semialdehyde aminotransferase
MHAVREITYRTGAIFILDEVMTAFRMHLGGAQAYFDVTPDVVCLGKAMTNGYPLSAIAGRRNILRYLPKVYYSMTYQSDSLAFALAAACLNYLVEHDVPGLLRQKASALRAAFDTAAIEHGLPARATGWPVRLNFTFPAYGALTSSRQERIFLDALTRHGTLPTLSAYACEQLSPTDIRDASGAFRAAMREIAETC